MKLTGSKGLLRYEMFVAGKSFQEIADEENVSVETVRGSVREEKVRRNLALRERVEHENNRLRRRVQRELEDAFLSALKRLLQGQKEVPFSVAGGDVVSRFIEDPKALMLGIEQYRKTVSLEEKPAPSHSTQILNVQQNSIRQPPERMEEIIARIRKRQLEAHRKAGLIDVEPIKTETKEPELEKKSGKRAESRCDKRWDS